MTEAPGPVPQIPDPTTGLRGVYAALLVLEAIVVGLALLVLPKFGNGATPLGVALIGGLAVAMVVASGLQRRPWGLRLALALQVATVACGLLVPALGVMGLVFAGWSAASCRRSGRRGTRATGSRRRRRAPAPCGGRPRSSLRCDRD